MHDELTIEATRWRGVRELEKSRDAVYAALRPVREAYERAEELAERAEAAIRDRNREEVSEWARKVLDEPEAVILSLGTTGLQDPMDVVEVVVLDTAGETVFSERVQPVGYEGGCPVEIEAGATDMHGHTAKTLDDAPTLAEVWPRLEEILRAKWVIIYNREYAAHVLLQTLDRYSLSLPADAIGCAMIQYARLEGHWSLEDETYRPVPLPNRDGTPDGNAQALHALLRDLAGRVPVSSGHRRNDETLIEEDLADIPF